MFEQTVKMYLLEGYQVFQVSDPNETITFSTFYVHHHMRLFASGLFRFTSFISFQNQTKLSIFHFSNSNIQQSVFSLALLGLKS